MRSNRILGNQIIEVNRLLWNIENEYQDFPLLNRLKERLKDTVHRFHSYLTIIILVGLLIIAILRISSLR
jgi:SRSO17 transposase